MTDLPRNENAAEGWDLFDFDGSGLMQIQRDDEANIFTTDGDAVAYVIKRACEGSVIHLGAKARHFKDSPAIAAIVSQRVGAMISQVRGALSSRKSYTPTLNKADLYIKAMLLAYPSVFESRFSVLKSLFLGHPQGMTDTGWTAGCIDLSEHPSPTAEMSYTDLQEREVTYREGLKDAGLQRINAARLAGLQREYTARRMIAEDIDLYATAHVMGESQQSGVEWLEAFDPETCVMATASYDAMDKDWALAAEDILTIAGNALWRKLGMMNETFNRATANHTLLRKYDAIVGWLNTLNMTTGTQDAHARAMAYITGRNER